MSRTATDSPGVSQNICIYICMYVGIYISSSAYIVFVASPASSRVELHHAFSSTPFIEGRGCGCSSDGVN